MHQSFWLSQWQLAVLCMVAGLMTGRHAAAQANPVYVDDSPQAWELFRQAVDQSAENTGEAVRLFQQLLDEFPLRLIPAFESAEGHYRSVRGRVLDQISSNPELLERYQLIASAEAARMLEAGDVERLAITRALTMSGLKALLRLGQHDLERARFASAISWLDEAINHPAISLEQESHAWYMLGVAAGYSGNLALLQEARQALASIGETAAEHHARLDALDGLSDLPGSAGVDVMQISESGDLADVVAHSIWNVTLDRSLLRRRLFNGGQGADMLNPVVQQRRLSGRMMTAAPTVVGSTVYISEGHRIAALDRFTGNVRWMHDNPPSLSTAGRGDSSAVLDMNIIAVKNGTLVALYGHAQETSRTDDGRVICLDAATGDRRWIRRINRINAVDEYDGLFAYGTPIIADGRVFLLGRKVSQQNLTSVYVLALDEQDGSLDWIRYITSSGTVRRTPGRPFSSLVYRDGELLVASPIGAIAKLTARTGQIQWLRRFSVPITLPFQDAERRPWEISTAAWTPRGVLAIQPDQTRVVLLDHHTGEQIDSFAASPNIGWGSPNYLLSNDRLVYAIGSDVRAFRIDDLATPSWQLPSPMVSSLENFDGMERPSDFGPQQLDINGRVQLTDRSLIVPTSTGVIVADNETGYVHQTLDLHGMTGGNPLAHDSQLLLAGSDELHAFMSFARAEEMLRERLDAEPDDPDPALSLVRLAVRVRNIDLMLEGAAIAMKRIDAAPGGTARAHRDELFSMMLAVNLRELTQDRDPGEAFFDRLGQVATSDAQRAEHRLAWGDWLLGVEPSSAADVYQQILDDTSLAMVTRVEDDLLQTGARWASQRLLMLQRLATDQIYRTHSTAAATQLTEITSEATPDPERLLALADRYPLASAAIDARLLAAEVFVSAGDTTRAMSALLDGYRLMPTDDAAAALLGRYIALCESAGRISSAWEMLSFVREEHTTARLLGHEDGPRLASRWQNEMGGLLDRQREVRVGNVDGLADAIPGRIVTRLTDNPASRRHHASADAFLIERDARLTLIDASTLEEQWTADFEVAAPTVLQHTDDLLVIWAATDPQDPHAVGLDPATGEQLWTTPRLSEVIGDVVRDLNQARAIRDRLGGNDPFDPRQTLPLLARDRMVLIRRTGGVAAFDIADASQAIWTRPTTMEQVHFAIMNEHAIVLAGAAAARGGRRGAPVVLALDPDNGEMLWQSRSLASEQVRWLVDVGSGRLLCGSEGGIVACDLLTGEPLWANVGYAATDAQRAWPVGGNVIFETQSSLQGINATTGLVTQPFEGPATADWNPFDVQEVLPVEGQDMAFVRFIRRVVVFTSDGRVLGADIVNEDRDYRWIIPTVDRLIVISGRAEQSLVRDARGRRTQYFYRIYTMSRNGRLEDRPHDLPPLRRRIRSVDIVNGRVLMSSENDQTLVIPAPADS